MTIPSMKVPPKRKGNAGAASGCPDAVASLNESPSEKEGKSPENVLKVLEANETLNESPSEKEGKSEPSTPAPEVTETLNESPSEKEGK